MAFLASIAEITYRPLRVENNERTTQIKGLQQSDMELTVVKDQLLEAMGPVNETIKQMAKQLEQNNKLMERMENKLEEKDEMMERMGRKLEENKEEIRSQYEELALAKEKLKKNHEVYDRRCNEFVEAFLEWRPVRQTNIDNLEKLTDDIKKEEK